ncbi:hypothetical protein BDM02DRAFT_843031 [Thelephora ganbajun]|uniref:Uncharacterized protein n=1 Tax=Thelephora ganbajun TaxID=370292 RepID=A0ACB6Z686_THEGA|nr:hypothetical protein BDM02DRAFT_843031 [Thelephora ganbajun]
MVVLDLFAMEGIARRLLNLPNGLHFRRLIFSWRDEGDPRWMEELVVACSDTLESLDITHNMFIYTSPAPIDLSKATKLRNAIFRAGSLNIAWITLVLQTISPGHRDLRQISIHVRRAPVLATVDDDKRQAIGGQWLNLDRLLVQFWESHSIRTKVVCETPGQGVGEHIGRLLPEVTKRGTIDLVEVE